ncbi:galactose mutarotase-like protein [Anaeromyces robustus]|jgi:glucose-6-phosphate 1-epimerase|uniref:Glucose-6-phosphate 1-epimerase n=1 Tax=Anaeromyces robustus TaxID=1754192 RepID=A0A1Y1X5M2_9FUNG|nr:galactose mutarotase-like protein [Anaeromyces robustus]|eukprot:ORX80656.1 galactose mutarotase-like protein [Anaeromyces robustus]
MSNIDLIRDSNGNLIKVKINNTNASAEIYMFGATLTSWVVNGQERLFLSKKAILNGTKAIRGGIPIVFPQFNTKLTTDLPSHGFARITTWKWGGININTPDRKEVSFILTDKEVNKKYLEIWPHQFKLVYTVLLDGKSLSTSLRIKNTGNEPWLFNTLLHTYFNVDDLTEAGVNGLINCNYIDTSPEGNGEKKIEDRQKIVFQKEVDSIYYDVNQKNFKLQTGFKNDIMVEKCTLPDVVVWNPWIEKSKRMADFGEESYPHMFCFEVGSVYQPIELDVDAVYEGGQVLTVV